MRRSLHCYTLSALVAALLAGCGGSQPPIGAPGAIALETVRNMPAQHGKGTSWVRATSSSQELLYISGTGTGAGNSVDIYTFPQGQLVGVLSDLNTYTFGECTDSQGDIFIVTDSGQEPFTGTIYEYAHGSTQPKNILTDPGSPDTCSVDPVTGNLAVANFTDRSNPYNPYFGDVAIYSSGQGSPTMYYSTTYILPYAIAYTGNGTLYIVSESESAGDQLVQVDLNNSEFLKIDLNVKIENSHTDPVLQWDGKHLTLATVADIRLPLPIYRLHISGKDAKVSTTTKLRSRKNRFHASAIQGAYAVAADNGSEPDVSFWAYPKGGKPFHTLKDVGGVTGLALSVGVTH